MIAKHIDRFPLLKLDQVIDWQPIEQYLNRQKSVTVDATIIQTAGSKQRQAIEVDEEGQVSGQTTPSTRAAYFGLLKVSAQSHLKAMCLNLLKAANRLSVPVCA